jgi:hypothetical protein
VKGTTVPAVVLSSHPDARSLVEVRVTAPAVVPVVGSREPQLIHVRKPLVNLTATFGPFVRLFVPVANDTDARAKFELLKSLVGRINELEAFLGRAGVELADAVPNVENGELVASFVPNDPANGVERCKRIAHYLWAAQGGAAVRVYDAEKPEAPVFEIAA